MKVHQQDRPGCVKNPRRKKKFPKPLLGKATMHLGHHHQADTNDPAPHSHLVQQRRSICHVWGRNWASVQEIDIHIHVAESQISLLRYILQNLLVLLLGQLEQVDAMGIVCKFKQVFSNICYMWNKEAIANVPQTINLLPSLHGHIGNTFTEFIFKISCSNSVQYFTI